MVLRERVNFLCKKKNYIYTTKKIKFSNCKKTKGKNFNPFTNPIAKPTRARAAKNKKNFGKRFLNKSPAFSSGKTLKMEEATIND